MAETDEKNQEQEQKSEKDKEKKSFIGRLLPWIVMIIIVGLCAGAGLGLGRIIAGTSQDNVTDSNDKVKAQDIAKTAGSIEESGKLWYYELEPPVVANLNEPGITRYVSASLTLQMSSADEKETRAYLDEKTPILRNWLYIFLSGLSIDNIQGDKNLKSIQSQICDGFNQELFPDSKPQIKQILIREFPVQ